MVCHLLNIDQSVSLQTEADTTYLGGQPHLPPDVELPFCGLCGSEQTFFFQVTFPRDHAWSALSLAVFACTSCVDDKHYIPQILPGKQKGRDIHEGCLATYQVNFRFLVFPTYQGCLRQDYVPKIRFKRWLLEPTQFSRSPHSKIGGVPRWILDNEAPATYNKTVPMIFLLQIERGFHYDLLPGTPGQAVSSYKLSDGSVLRSPERYYTLFVANALYLFGTNDATTHLVYAVVQS